MKDYAALFSCTAVVQASDSMTALFYGDLVFKFMKIIGNINFSDLFKRIVNSFKRAVYTLDVMRQTACLVLNLEGYAALFGCTAVVQA